jgi:hypothetical protein
MGKESLEKKQTKVVESKETEKLPPILLIYRDNDLFQKAVPEIEKQLISLGHKVEIERFSKETDKRDIEKWVKEHKERFENKEILGDETCGWGKLDSFVNVSISEAVLGKDNEYTKGVISKIVKNILLNKENMPNYVEIVSAHLLDHKPLSDLKGNTEARREIEKWLIDGGISSELFKSPSKANVTKSWTRWRIADRHEGGGSGTFVDSGRPNHKTIRLRLPLGNFVVDAAKSNLINMESRVLEKYKKILKRYINFFSENLKE